MDTTLAVNLLVMDSLRILYGSILFIAAIIVRFVIKARVFRTRGLFPFVGILGTIGGGIYGVIYFSTIVSGSSLPAKPLCFVNQYLLRWIYITNMVLIPMQYLRYILINNYQRELGVLHHQLAENVIAELSKSTTDSFRKKTFFSTFWLRLSKYLTGDIIGVVITLIVAFVWDIGAFFYDIATQFQCLPGTEATTAFTVVSMSCVGLCLLTMAIDFAFNYKLLMKCKLKQFYWDDDPYLFRIEYLCYVIVYFDHAVINYLLRMIPGGGLAVLWIVFLSSPLIMFVMVVMPMISSFIRRTTEKMQFSPTDVKGALQNSLVLSAFEDYAKKEWSFENVSCWKSLIAFRESKTMEEMKKRAADIYRIYLAPDSKMQTNLRSKEIAPIAKRIEAGDIDKEMFKEIETEVLVNLSDTFQRFQKTWKYQEIVSKQQTAQNIQV